MVWGLFKSLILAFQGSYLYISPGDYLLNQLTILGILATMVALVTTLSKDVRQDLIEKYYLRSKFALAYVSYLLASFLLVVVFYYNNLSKTNVLVSSLLVVTYVYTLIFVVVFIRRMNRAWLYREIVRRFKKELKQRKKDKLKDPNVAAIVSSNSLNDLLKNISYVAKSSTNFTEEANAVRQIVIAAMKNMEFKMALHLFYRAGVGVLRIHDEDYFDDLITMLYDLRFEESATPTELTMYQEMLYPMLANAFLNTERFNPRLNTAGLYLREFLDIRFLDEFKSTDDQNWIANYDNLIGSTINWLYGLCRLILEKDFSHSIKKKYLTEQLGQLNKSLEHYEHMTQSSFSDDYLSIISKKTKTPKEQTQMNLAEQKYSLLEKKQRELQRAKLELFYRILTGIDLLELPRDFFELAMKLYNSRRFQDEYFKGEGLPNLDHTTYDDFEGGAQAIPSFDYDRYRLLIVFYLYLQKSALTLNKFSKEILLDGSLETALSSFEIGFVTKYFDTDKNAFSSFKENALAEILEIKKNLANNEKKYLVHTPLKPEYVHKFNDDCNERWETNQKNISQFVDIDSVAGGKDLLFGQALLISREWFMEPYNKNVGLARNAGSDAGGNQGRSKFVAVVNKMNTLFDESAGDSTLVIGDLSTDLVTVVEEGEEYWLFYKSDLNIYDIPGIEWVRHDLITARIKIKNAVINLCACNANKNILVKKGSFKLQQYTKILGTETGGLYIAFEEIKDKIARDLVKSNRFESEEEAETHVLIKVYESFDIIRLPGGKLIRLQS